MLSNRLVFHTHEMDLLANSSVALLFAGDRLDHLQHTVLPKLEEGIIVICERYYLSSYAYQMGEDPKNLEWLTTINSRCIQPDITFFLKTSLSISEKRRARDRWYQELYEKPQILGQVEKNYDFVIEKIKQNHTPIEIVDGNSSEKVVFGQIVSAFKKNFPEMFPKDVPLFENR
jgi:dTMP kinase